MAQGLWGWNAGSRITEFLNRQLPRFEFHFGPRYHPRPKDDPAPLVVLAWNGVDTQINDFVDSLDARPRLSHDSIQVNLPYRASEADLASQMQLLASQLLAATFSMRIRVLAPALSGS